MATERWLMEEVIGTPVRVDADKGILHDCLLLGTTSRNGVRYPDETRAGAVALFEGAKVNLSHPAKRDRSALAEPTPWDRRYGRAFNVRNTPEGIRGDVKVLKAHAFTKTLMEAAQEMPEMFGFSPVMLGICSPRDASGMETCNTIKRVRSIDIVTDPGTTRTLFEDEEAPAPPDVPEGEEGESESTRHHEAALMHIILDEVEAFLDEELEPEHTSGRIHQHLKHHAKMHHAKKEEEPKEEAKEEPKAEEHEEEVNWEHVIRGQGKALVEEAAEPARKPVSVQKVKSGIKAPVSDSPNWLSILRK